MCEVSAPKVCAEFLIIFKEEIQSSDGFFLIQVFVTRVLSEC